MATFLAAGRQNRPLVGLAACDPIRLNGRRHFFMEPITPKYLEGKAGGDMDKIRLHTCRYVCCCDGRDKN